MDPSLTIPAQMKRGTNISFTRCVSRQNVPIIISHSNNRLIVERAEAKLGVAIADKYTVGGKEFRKYLADRFAKEIAKWSGRKPAECKLEGEKAASEFFVSIGVEFIEWPYSWTNPDKGSNRAVLDDSVIEIIQVNQVQLDDKKQLIPGSHKTIK